MFNKQIAAVPADQVVTSLIVSGFITTGGKGQQQALVARLSAVLGRGVGVQRTGDARGYAVGAAAGSLLGWGAASIRLDSCVQSRPMPVCSG